MKYMILPAIMVFATNAFADTVGDKQLTSRAYVDNTLDTKQDKIPAAGKSGVAAGDTVMTYTPGGNGVIGERGIYSNTNVYNANTDGDKLITASALNNAFNSLPTVETSTMICANPPTCTLWTITDDTAYGIDPAMLLDANATGYCFRRLETGQTAYYIGAATQSTLGANGTCTTAPVNYGDWGTVFDVNGESIQVGGISACSSLAGDTRGAVASDQSVVQSDYESNIANAPTSTVGTNCYCKLTDPDITAARWIWLYINATTCARYCAYACGKYLEMYSDVRHGMFGIQ